MSIWRPHPEIRVKALGLHWRDRRLLAAEVLDDQRQVKGVRPLGGSVMFGETAQDAVVREFKEELDLDIQTAGSPFFMENLFTHEGSNGHEVLIIFNVVFPAGAFADETRITFQEDNGVTCHAEWFDLDRLDVPGTPQLFPQGLKTCLQHA
ncbi:MAG: NUDIX hydrolase [Roseobacter sp.]